MKTFLNLLPVAVRTTNTDFDTVWEAFYIK